MDATQLSCPTCGAALGRPLQDGFYLCAYCGHRSEPPQLALDTIGDVRSVLAVAFGHQGEADPAERQKGIDCQRRRLDEDLDTQVSVSLAVGIGFLAGSIVPAVAAYWLNVWFLLPALLLVGIGTFFFRAGMRARNTRKNLRKLRANGLRGRAVVTTCSDVVFSRPRRYYHVVLRVEVGDLEPYLVKRFEFVFDELDGFGRIESGMVVPVFVDPEDPNNFIVDWG